MQEIFVSRPSTIKPEYEPGLQRFLSLLHSHELNPRTLGTTDYPQSSPLDEVIRIMDQCVGSIILGYPQITVTNGSILNTPIDKAIILPTEWNHIEAALAYNKKLPLLIIHDIGVQRGIFDRGTLNGFLHEIDLTDSAWCLTESVIGALKTWKDKITSSTRESDTKSDIETEANDLYIQLRKDAGMDIYGKVWGYEPGTKGFDLAEFLVEKGKLKRRVGGFYGLWAPENGNELF